MAMGESGFGDVTFDLVSTQYHSLKAGHDFGQYVRDAKNAGLDDVVSFVSDVMAQDSERARRCREFLGQLQGTRRPDPPQDKKAGLRHRARHAFGRTKPTGTNRDARSRISAVYAINRAMTRSDSPMATFTPV